MKIGMRESVSECVEVCENVRVSVSESKFESVSVSV